MYTSKFTLDGISKEDMKKLANHIENYIDVLEHVMIIPDGVIKDQQDQIKQGIKTSKKLIEKLRKGDKSVFKDEDEFENII